MGYEEKFSATALSWANGIDKLPKTYNIFVLGAISCTAGFMFGMDIASMSFFVGLPAYVNYFHNPSSNLQGFITSSMALGSIFGCWISFFMSEAMGRRPTLMACCCLWCIGSAIQSSAQNVAQLIIGRIIGGLGVGLGSTVAPVYGSEVSPRHLRGTVGCLFQFCVTLGIMCMFFISYGLHFAKGETSFRAAWGIQILPGLLTFIGLFFIPESPRWLAKQECWEKSEDIVTRIHKRSSNDEDLAIEIDEIRASVESTHSRDFQFKDLFNKKYIERTFLAIFAQIWQQLTGMNTLMYYVMYIFQMAGYEGNVKFVSGCIQYVLNVVCTIPAFWLFDRVGRRSMLLTGALIMMSWQFAIGGILATYSKPYDNPDDPSVNIMIPKSDKSASQGVIACCYLFVCTYAVTWGVGIWGYAAELWGDSASRQRGAALSTSANWMFNFAIGMFTPSAFKNIKWKTYFVFGAFCGTMFLHVLFLFPETKDKRLEEIGLMWEAHVPAWRSASWTPAGDNPILEPDSLESGKGETDHIESGSNDSNNKSFTN